jgi:hypothetical protein
MSANSSDSITDDIAQSSTNESESPSIITAQEFSLQHLNYFIIGLLAMT